jgi:iron complex outermembrane receptor protein
MKAINYVFAFLFFVIPIPIPLHAQTAFKVEGTVMNDKNQPVEAAFVSVGDNHIATLSDKEGYYLLIVPAGETIQLCAGALGYVADTFQTTVIDDIWKDFILKDSNIELDEVVVVGDNKKYVRMSAPQNLIRIDKSFIEDNYSGSLMQSLEKIPGVRAMSIGSGQSKPAIRGLGFNRMVIAQNGIKHEGQQWGEEHGLEIDQFAVDDIEIIKGPGSLLYGSDAIGGVVNLRNDYLPAKTLEGSVNLFGRTNNESTGLSVRVTGRKKQFVYKAYLTLIDYADYKVPTDSIQYYSYYIKLKDKKLRNTAGRERNAGLSSGYVSDKFTSVFYFSDVFTESGFFADAHGLEVRLSDINYDKSFRDTNLPRHSVNHIKAVNHSTWQAGKFAFETDLSYQKNIRNELAEPVSHGYMPVPPDSLERMFDKNTYTASFKLKFLILRKHSVQAGLTLEHQNNERSGWGFIIPAFRTTSTGAYAYDRYHLSDELILSAGIRFDRTGTRMDAYRDWYKTPAGRDSVYKQRSADLKRTFSSFSWLAGVNYHTGAWNLKASIGKSFRAPIPKELGADGVNYHIFRYEKGEPSLTPEESYQADAGINWQNDCLTVQLDPYLNYFPVYIYLNPTADYQEGLQMYYYTQSRVIRAGFEAELTHRLSQNLEWGMNGEYLYARQLSGDKKGYTLPFSPPWSVRVEATYRPHTRWAGPDGHITLACEITGDQNEIVPPESTTKGYQTLNLSAGRSFAWKNVRMRFALQAQNLLDKKYYNHTSYYRLIDVPEPGRNFSMMTGFTF